AKGHRQRVDSIRAIEGDNVINRCEPRSDYLCGVESGCHARLHQRIQPHPSGHSGSSTRAPDATVVSPQRGTKCIVCLFVAKGPMLRKVLLLSASAGAGHVRAAEAIEKAS